jgi:type IV pilus assembly protein PilX
MRYPRLRAPQKGMALITGMLLLIVVTILAMSMFRGYGTQQKIAGNVREKNRAVSAAVSAQQYAEYWLNTATTLPVGGDCSGISVLSIPQVCSNNPDFAVVPWTLNTKPVGVAFNTFNSMSNVNPDNPTNGTYYSAPMFYITDLGPAAAGAGEVYQIDATGWGGTADTVAVVESTFLLKPSGTKYDKRATPFPSERSVSLPRWLSAPARMRRLY